MEQALRLIGAGRLEEARSALTRILRANPADFDANNALAVVLARVGEHERALFYADRALAARPDSAAALANRGNILYFIARFADAERDFTAGIRADPVHYPSWRGLAKTLLIQARLTEAERVCREGLERLPGDRDLRQVLAQVWMECGEPERAEPEYRRLASEPGAELEDLNWHAYCLNYTPGVEPRRVWDAHRAAGDLIRRRAAPAAARLGTAPIPRGDRLRVGILSSDLREHSVACFALPIIERLPRDRFEVFCYYTGFRPDALSERIARAATRWRHAWNRSPEDLTRLIRSDGVHILLELNGHTAGACLEAVALRPAPLIVTAIGYPNTTGLNTVDYRLVDSITDPPAPDGTDGGLASERLLRLDPCFLCYAPPSDAPDVARRPDEPPTFASFNACTKINETVLDVWCRILDRVPDSRLLLKNRALGDEGVRARLLARFRSRGIAPHRVEALGQTVTIPEHLALYARVDVALDTFPYCGTTTTCEALYMGVPVLTLAGSAEPGRHPWRVGASLLTAAGLPELITRSPEAYVDAAVRLAADADARREYRRTLRSRLLASPLCDAPGYARRVADALERIWRLRS
jgi:predicted O-linked N-acetylglucosamine transferase (SPINDLY family)